MFSVRGNVQDDSTEMLQSFVHGQGRLLPMNDPSSKTADADHYSREDFFMDLRFLGVLVLHPAYLTPKARATRYLLCLFRTSVRIHMFHIYVTSLDLVRMSLALKT